MDIGRLVNAADIAADVLRAQTERIASLERTVGEQADQIGGLASELERARWQADMNETHGRNLKHENCALKQKLAALQAEATALRKALIALRDRHLSNYPHRYHTGDGWMVSADRKMVDDALATPSAAAERVRLLEEVAKAAQKWLAPLSSSLTDSEMAEAIVKQNDALRDAVAALAALDAATVKETLTVEEVAS